MGWDVRAARGAVADLGWRPREVVALVVFLATTENDTRLAAQREAINQTFPWRGRALDEALAGGQFPGWGLTMVDPRLRGSRIWMGMRLDGRRLDAPYASYADFMRVVRVSSGAARGRR